MSNFDLDGDGYVDAVDSNADGYVDAVDTNADGYLDTFDTDADGYADTTDHNADGYADQAPAFDPSPAGAGYAAPSGGVGGGSAGPFDTNPYTQSELDAGYSQTDPSLIEPARFADDYSLISDNDTTTNL